MDDYLVSIEEWPHSQRTTPAGVVWKFCRESSPYSKNMVVVVFVFVEKYAETFSQQNSKIPHDQRCLLLVGKINEHCKHSKLGDGGNLKETGTFMCTSMKLFF